MTCLIGIKLLNEDVIIAADSCISWDLSKTKTLKDGKNRYVFEDEVQKIYPIHPNLTVAISGDLLAAQLALKHFKKRICQPKQQLKLTRASSRVFLITELAVKLIKYSFSYFKRKDLVVLLLAVTDNQGNTSLFSFSTIDFRLQKINKGESVILGSITRESIYPKFQSEISKISTLQRRSQLISTDQAGMVLADTTTRLLQNRVPGVGGLFQVGQFENGNFTMVSFDGYKIDKDKGIEYNVSLIFDPDHRTFYQKNNQTGQTLAVRSIDQHHFRRNPHQDKIFTY
jgi:hypothetical protein